jgi:hypothetical protein
VVHAFKNELHDLDKVFSQMFVAFQSLDAKDLLFDQQRTKSKVKLDKTVDHNFLVSFLENFLGHFLENGSVSACFFLKEKGFFTDFFGLLCVYLDC